MIRASTFSPPTPPALVFPSSSSSLLFFLPSPPLSPLYSRSLLPNPLPHLLSLPSPSSSPILLSYSSLLSPFPPLSFAFISTHFTILPLHSALLRFVSYNSCCTLLRPPISHRSRDYMNYLPVASLWKGSASNMHQCVC